MTANRNALVELEGAIAQGALVQYQPSAVISRTVIKSGGGSVTAFMTSASASSGFPAASLMPSRRLPGSR